MKHPKASVEKNSTNLVRTRWHRSIIIRAAVLAWLIIICTLLIFIIGILPTQKKIMEERMLSEGNDIASSIGQVTATAIINNDYAFTVEHCLKIIKESNSILYIIISRKDGFALVHSNDEWKLDTIRNEIELPKTKNSVGQFLYSKIVNQNVFHYSYPFNYSGIEWGRINVGLSLSKYNQGISELTYRTTILAVIAIVLGLVASIIFAGNLTRPILLLNNAAKRISEGDLTARANIKSKNELGYLASTFNKMTDTLKSSQEELEYKVEERTAELEKTNKALQIEINEKLAAEKTLKQYNSQLETFDKIYRGIIAAKSTDEIIIETITRLPLLFSFISEATVAINDVKFDHIKVNGIKVDEVNGNKLFTQFYPSVPDFENLNNSPLNTHKLENDIRLIENKNQMEIDILKEGLVSYISVPLAIEKNEIGIICLLSKTPNIFKNNHVDTLLYFSNQLSVAINQAQLQEKIQIHAKSLQNSLSEKEVLLKEIHHRVKNNLQVISSLLYLNSKKIKDADALKMFKESQNRVKSIALVHERLYQSKDLGKIDFKEYVVKLTNDLLRSFAVNTALIKLNIDVNNIFISIDTAVPCGLIINELISNSLKYAFPDKEAGGNQINICFQRSKDGELSLEISDNGVGLPSGFDIKNTQSLGLQLVETLILQLEGTREIDSTNGLSIKLKFGDKNS